MDTMLSNELRRIRALRTQFENFLLDDIDGSREREARKFLTKRPCWVNDTPAQEHAGKRASTILKLVGSVALFAITASFVVCDHFVVNTTETATVKIAYVAHEVLTDFGPIAQREEMVLNYHDLTKKRCGLTKGRRQGIIPILGGEQYAETDFGVVSHLMKKQGHGQAGTLLTNGYANIFYIRNSAGVLRTVRVCWRGDGWVVNVYAVGYPRPWNAGYRVFSRKVLKSLDTLGVAQA